MKDKIRHLSEKYYEPVVTLRRRIHAHPELSWQEVETSKLVAETLMKAGIEVQTRVAKNGVVGTLRCKNSSSKCIALRADMDALPIHEENELSYCSANEGVMHACGHDVHTANLLGVAMILSNLRNEIEGTYKFFFQPSEETNPSGALEMIKEEMLENPQVQKIIGLHVSPEIEAGKVGFCPGRFMASSDEIYLTIVGKGGHAARVEELKNPILIAAEILLELKTITNPQIPLVLSFGKIEGKGATNVVPDVVEIAGTLRCFDENLRAQTQQLIATICESIAEQYIANCHVLIEKGNPVLINDEVITRTSQLLAQDYLRKENVLDVPIRMGSEDFAYYTHQIPACFYRLGVSNKKLGITSGLHTSTFNVDENVLKESMGLMSWIAINS